MKEAFGQQKARSGERASLCQSGAYQDRQIRIGIRM